jgi:glycosyltransferase involved in cell wall biosynthesis
MNITYVLLSPTFGMHQYTADLANRAVVGTFERCHVEPLQPGDAPAPQRANVALVTTATLPRDRYSPAVTIHTPVTTQGTGFSREGLDIAAYRRVLDVLTCQRANVSTCQRVNVSTLAHFTGVHAWNIPLVRALRRRGVPVVHTLHDLDPHHGVRYPALIRLWNRLIIASGCHLLVHGRRYRDQLLAAGVAPARVTYTPLLHGFLAADRPWPPERWNVQTCERANVKTLERANDVLFFGRVEAYKGVDTLLAAWTATSGDLRMNSSNSWQTTRLIIAGPVARDVTLPPLPPAVELRNRRVADDEAEALFRSAAVLVLPYRDATQSALVAAAYAFGVPVIVTEVGALPEYVVAGATGLGETGWVAPPGDAGALAAVMREALADPARLRRMGAAGRAWFEARRREEQGALGRMYASQFAEPVSI